jgi:DNA-binding beta-propeller fold protein YncE
VKIRIPFLVAGLALFGTFAVAAATVAFVPVGRQPDGSVLTEIGQRLEPAGSRVEFAGRPNAVAASPDGATVAVANIVSLDFIDRATRARTSYPYPGAKGHTGTSEAQGNSIAYAPAGDIVFVTTRRDALQRFDVAKHTWLAPITFAAGPSGQDNAAKTSVGVLPDGVAVSPDGKRLYVTLNAANVVDAVDTATGHIVASTRTGIAPGAVALRGGVLAVLNEAGDFPKDGDVTRKGGHTGEMIPIDPTTGLAHGGTLSLLDASTLAVRSTVQLGRHPAAAIFLDNGTLAVAEANDDDLALVDTARAQVIGRTKVGLPGDGGWGAEPQALALSPDGNRLYVALAGANALAAYDLSTRRAPAFVGALPTDWYPGAIATFPDGGLALANLRGVGSLATVSNDPPAVDDMPACGRTSAGAKMPEGGHDSHEFEGTVALLTAGDLASAGARTTSKAVALANASRSAGGSLPRVDHVFLIVRENRAYDQVLGDLPQGHGDPRFTNFPRRVTPNAHALAEQYVLLDNFYTDGTQSGDGHQWIAEAATSDYIERSFPLWARSYPKNGDDPMAYAAGGFLWVDALQHGRSVRDYGEFAATTLSPKATWTDYYRQGDVDGTLANARAHSDIPSLDAVLDHRFPGFNTTVPDQVRVREFLREFAQFERNGKLPNLVMMNLGDDHTSGFDPGFPRPCSMIADNDLALGRIVQAISHSRYWKSSLILVTEDDSQDGLDHVSGNRTVGLAIGPYVKRHVVVSTLYSQVSMVRTAEAALGLPPMNRFDAAAPVMSDVFARAPNMTPYVTQPANLALADMNPPVAALHGERRRLALASMSWSLVDHPDGAPPSEMQRLLWVSTLRDDLNPAP